MINARRSSAQALLWCCLCWLSGIEMADAVQPRQAEQSITQLPDGNGRSWACRYAVDARHHWYVQCEDVKTLMEGDPALEGAAVKPRHIWNIPLHSTPFDDERTLRLARALMCFRALNCTVALERSPFARWPHGAAPPF